MPLSGHVRDRREEARAAEPLSHIHSGRCEVGQTVPHRHEA